MNSSADRNSYVVDYDCYIPIPPGLEVDEDGSVATDERYYPMCPVERTDRVEDLMYATLAEYSRSGATEITAWWSDQLVDCRHPQKWAKYGCRVIDVSIRQDGAPSLRIAPALWGDGYEQCPPVPPMGEQERRQELIRRISEGRDYVEHSPHPTGITGTTVNFDWDGEQIDSIDLGSAWELGFRVGSLLVNDPSSFSISLSSTYLEDGFVRR